MFQEDTENGPKGTFEIYRAEGDNLYKNAEYKKAIQSYSTALQLRESDPECHVSRSRCHLRLGDTINALLDAEAALTERANFHKGLFQKAEALYCKGEFEMALMFYHRGHKLRPELEEFRLGIQKAQEAIDNSIGSPERVTLTMEGDLTYFREQNMPRKRTKAKDTRPPGKTRAQAKAVSGKKEPPKICSENVKTMKQLLGELYGDKIYLETLLLQTDPSTGTGREVYDLAYSGLHYLTQRVEFWRQQKPMYARSSTKPRKPGLLSLPGKGKMTKLVMVELHKIDRAISEGNNADVMKMARKLLKIIELQSDDTLPNRADMECHAHSYLGLAYASLGQHTKAIKHHQADLDLANKHDLEDARSRAIDNLGQVYARSGFYQKAIDIWSGKVETTKVALELTWLYHEIGRCHMELGQMDQALTCGEQAVTASLRTSDKRWKLNSKVLVAECQLKMGKLSGALASLEKAHQLAKECGDKMAAAATNRAAEELRTKVSPKTSAVIQPETAEDTPPPVTPEDATWQRPDDFTPAQAVTSEEGSLPTSD